MMNSTFPTSADPATTAKATTAVAGRHGVSRRWLLATVGAAAALPLAAACGAGNDQAASLSAVPVTITFGSKWASGPRLETINAALPMFSQQYPKITVNFHPITGDNAATIVTMFASGTPDDVVLMAPPQFPKLRDSGALVDIGPLIKADKIDVKKYTPSDPLYLNGNKRYGMPFQLVVVLFFVNKTMFKQAGLALPTEQWTWNDWADAAKKLTNPEKNQYGVGGPFNSSVKDQVLFGIASNGGHYISPDYKKTLLSEPVAIEAIQWFSDRINKDRSWVGPTVSGLSFGNGDFAMSRTDAGSIGSQTAGSTKDLSAKFEFDLLPLPRAPRTGKAMTPINEQTHTISVKSGGSAARVDAAFKFAVFMAGKDVQLFNARSRGSIPVYRELVTSAPYTDSPPASMSLVAKWLENVTYERMFPDWQEWHDAVSKELAGVWAGQVSPESGAKNATAAGDAILSRAGPKSGG